MDNPVTHRELNAFKELMESENSRLDDENNRQNKRLEVLEDNSKQLTTLATAVEKLALSMENMAKEQASQGERLETLESRDGEKWRQVTSYILTTVISIVLGYFFCTFRILRQGGKIYGLFNNHQPVTHYHCGTGGTGKHHHRGMQENV